MERLAPQKMYGFNCFSLTYFSQKTMDRKYKINTFALVKNLKTMRRIHMLTSNLLLTLGMGLLQVGCAQSTADRSTDVNGHHFVDLQLPSGLLWADTNIGAESPTDCGQQFAWGDEGQG